MPSFGLAIGAWLVSIVLGVVFWAAVIYAAVHFISKFW